MKYCNILLLCIATAATAADVLEFNNNPTRDSMASSCDTLTSLAQALYDTKGNVLNLMQVFYPPRQPGVSFVRVTYNFENDEGHLDGCNVAYIWAIGGFMLIQPPSILRFTSLFFSHNVNMNYKLTLRLPFACRHLVTNISLNGSSCSCGQEMDDLDMLTHQLKLYAKYTDVSHVVQDDTTHTYAICETEIDSNYYVLTKGKKYYEILLFLIVTLLMPFISITLTATVVRSLQQKIHTSIIKKINHQNLAGMVLTGMFVTFYIVGCDIAAFYYAYSGKNELSGQHQLKGSLNFLSTAILLALNITFCILPVMVLVYVCCTNLRINTDNIPDEGYRNRCLRSCNDYCIGQCCFGCCLYGVFAMSFSVLLGRSKNRDWWQNDRRLVWIMILSLTTPLFAISSHITFILVSWLIDTKKASSVALICFAALIYLFFMFRQCYKANLKVNPKHCCCSCCSTWLSCSCWSCFLPFYPFLQCLTLLPTCFYVTCDKYCDFCKKCLADDQEEDLEATINQRLNIQNERYDPDPDNVEFNTKAFCIVFSWGLVLVGTVALVIIAFAELPIVTFDLLSDLLNTFQVFIILISLLITYKILGINEPDIYRFLRKLRVTFRELRTIHEPVQNEEEDNDVEAAGYIMGELAKVVIHKFPKERVHH